MYEMALEEIEFTKEEFPIMTFEVQKDKKFYYPYEETIELNVSEYKNELGELNFFNNNIYLTYDNLTEYELDCHLSDIHTKYCKLQNQTIEPQGQYMINVKERIQKTNYAVKAHESNAFEIIQLFNKSKQQTDYTFNIGTENVLKIIINLNTAIDFALPVYFENKKELSLKCESKETNYECEINKTFCETNCKVEKDKQQQYKINIMSKSEKSILELGLIVKNEGGVSPDDGGNTDGGKGDEDSDILIIVLPTVIGGLVIIAIIVICVIRKRKKVTSDDIEPLSVGLKESELKEESS